MSTAHASISATFGYDFKKLDLLKEALDTTDIYYPEANERLAMLGKSLINLNLLHDWFPSNEPEESGKKMLLDVASNKNLERVARKIGLVDHLVFHAGQVHGVDGPSDDVLATALQAVIGAIDIDSDQRVGVVRAAMNKIGLTAAATE